jgi:hypothetical protein
MQRVWLVHVVGGSEVETLLSNDFTTGDAPWTSTMLLQLAPSPSDLASNYFRYEQRNVGVESQIFTLLTLPFAVARNHASLSNSAFYDGLRFSDVTGAGTWDLLRETMFIFDADGWPTHRWEQVYRGPDGQLYAFRLANGPQLFRLSDMVAEGYGMYDVSEFDNAPSLPPKHPKTGSQRLPQQQRPQWLPQPTPPTPPKQVPRPIPPARPSDRALSRHAPDSARTFTIESPQSSG